MTDSDIKPQNEAVAKRLVEARKQQRLSQMDLAARAGISQGFLAMVEANRKVPTLTTVFKLAAALGIRPASLFEEAAPDRDAAKAEIVSLIQRNL